MRVAVTRAGGEGAGREGETGRDSRTRTGYREGKQGIKKERETDRPSVPSYHEHTERGGRRTREREPGEPHPGELCAGHNNSLSFLVRVDFALKYLVVWPVASERLGEV